MLLHPHAKLEDIVLSTSALRSCWQASWQNKDFNLGLSDPSLTLLQHTGPQISEKCLHRSTAISFGKPEVLVTFSERPFNEDRNTTEKANPEQMWSEFCLGIDQQRETGCQVHMKGDIPLG